MMQVRIGKYEIQSELGQGGFGKVYRAYDPSMGRAVAIKVVTSDGDPDLLARFQAEAVTHGKLHHQNIVTIYEFGEQNGSPYIVMELLEGENLQTLIQTKRNLTLLEKMRIMYQVAEGLHYAHQAGVVHRDVKPANLMLLPGGLVKIMDFGIARLVDAVSSRRTRGGDLIGTTLYMAPEQFRGADADIQSDVFAYGVIYYELLSGVHPFQAADVSAIIYRIMSVDPLALREVAPECPKALEVLVHRALAKDRARRYTDLDDAFLDADPIMQSLRRDEAARLLSQVAALVTEGDFDRAHSTLKHALELDPSNTEARRLRESLQEERNKRLLQQAVDEMERDGVAKMSQRQFSDALQTFEAALRMKPDDSHLQVLVTQARGRMLGSREASRLLSEAKREAQSDRLAEARALALKALELDPDNPEAPALALHLEDLIAKIESAQRLNAGMEEAERLLAEKKYVIAIEKLAAIESEYPGSHQIGELHNRVRQRQAEHERRERLDRLESGLKEIRAVHRAGELSDALELIAVIHDEFHGVAALENLKAAIEEEVSARARLAEISKLLQDSRDLLWAKRLAECIAMLENGRRKFGTDAGIERILEAARALEQEAERQSGVLAILASARDLRAQERFDDANELLKSGIRLHGQDVALSDLSRVIGLQVEDRRATERIENYCSKAEALLRTGSPSDALAVLREARSQYPSEPSLELLLGTAEDRYARQSEQEIVSSILNGSADRQQAGDLAGAMEEIARGLRRLPAARELLQAAAVLRDKLQSAERDKQMDRFVRDVGDAIKSSDWVRARSGILAGKREYPDQIVFDELAVQVQAKQHEADTEKALAGVREFLKAGNLERAAMALAELAPVYGFEETWYAEKRNLERLQGYAADLRKAEELRKSGRYEDAEIILRRLVADSPPNGQAAALLKVNDLDRISARNAKRIVWAEGAAPVSTGKETGPGTVVRRIPTPLPPAPPPGTPRPATPRPEAEALKTRIRGMCPNCRVILPPSAKFCDRCGRQVG
jgi:serine/threonine protein kinase